MSKAEFAGVLAFLSAGIGKPLPHESAEVYWEMLGDLPLDALRAAAKKVLLRHQWSTFPSIAELREAATLTNRGEVAELTPADAWLMASQAVAKIDPEIRGPYRKRCDGQMQEFASQADAVLSTLPPVVVKAIRAYGLHPMCYGQEPMGVVRGQFLKIYEQVAATEKTRALLPAALQKEIEAKSATLPSVASAAIGQIGVEK